MLDRQHETMSSILLIEPDDELAAVLAEALRGDGYGVSRAESPGAALALLVASGSDAWRAILSPHYSDPLAAPYAWLDCLRAATGAAIIVRAGYPADAFVDWRRRGIAALLEEPFDLDDLSAALASACGDDLVMPLDMYIAQRLRVIGQCDQDAAQLARYRAYLPALSARLRLALE